MRPRALSMTALGLALSAISASAAPRVTAPVLAEDALELLAIDDVETLLVSAADDETASDQLRIAFAAPGETTPTTAWTRGDRIAFDQVADLALDGELGVFVQDDDGRITYGLHSIPGVGRGNQACGTDCSSSGSGNLPSASTVALFAMIALVGFRRRR